MNPTILGLHHVTATVNAAQPDLDFCVGTLGLRLVKKTVNFDNHNVYHFTRHLARVLAESTAGARCQRRAGVAGAQQRGSQVRRPLRAHL